MLKYKDIYVYVYIYVCVCVHIYICVRARSLQSCPTLCNPMNCSPPGSSVHEIFQARVNKYINTQIDKYHDIGTKREIIYEALIAQNGFKCNGKL